jgi:hypothetical protein
MTKKFWNDWKRRIGETKQVYLCRHKTKWFDEENSLRYSKDLLDLWIGERILSYKFNGSTIELVIERKIYTEGGPWPLCYHYETQNECVTIHRKDIVSVEFKK